MSTNNTIPSSPQKPHAVCIPFPAQGHINPMLKLSLLLHQTGFHITFIHTHHNHRRLLKSQSPDSLSGLPDFRFETIPDGLPLATDSDSTQDILSLCESTSKYCLAPFRELLERLNSDPGVPPVTSVVCDAAMAFAVAAAAEIGVPSVGFRTTSAFCFLCNKQYGRLKEKGIIPLKDASYLTNGYLDTVIDWIPGIKNIRLKDFPSFIRTTNLNNQMLDFIAGELHKVSKASAIIFNTFDALERDVLDALSSMYPQIYAIGPLHLFQIPQNISNSVRSNLWKEQPECLEWLNSQQPNSVIYVNFGSITILTPQQLVEFAWGLANSKKNFLWIIRPDLVVGEKAILPTEFVEETKERSFITGWCPQEQVLNHPSVSGFLTHCGWNSMVESLCSGVPILCWPFFADQHPNCRLGCTEWGVGIEIDSDVKRDEVDKAVRELMDGKKGKEMRRNAMEWKRKAEEAISLDGSSFLNLDKLVKEVLLSKQ